jgi:hypothetical protein
MLERFQEATVAAAFKALTKAKGSHRFLIADEVGLGKTISAKALADKLQQSLGTPLNILYFCPNLDIAAQNLTKLQTLAPEQVKPEDRLSLVLRARPAQADKFRVFCYTPDTSLPGWKHGRTGRKAERDLIADLLHTEAPTCWLRVRELEKEHFVGKDTRWFTAHRSPPPPHIVKVFVRSLRDILDFTGKPFDKALTAWLEDHGDVSELILRCRSALALAALRHTASRPDLLILDEFHRYADLILPATAGPPNRFAKERTRSLGLLTKTLLGDGISRPALLLLSATPYRLIRLDKGELPGSRYDHFGKLVHFLYGGGATAQTRRVQNAIVQHQEALARRDETALAAINEAREQLEAILRPVIARTERATDIEGGLFDRFDQPAAVESRDLQTFRHLAIAIDKGTPTLRAWAQPLWSSVPYPAETLFNYKACDALGHGLPPVTIASSRGDAAHPLLRTLLADDGPQKATVNYEHLSLPWLPPTQRWWKLGGHWRGMDEPGRAGVKGLLFSRYRGTPAAVSTWISSEVDRRSTRHKSKGKFVSQTYLRPSGKSPWPLIALFMPWPTLSTAFEPVRGKHLTILAVQKAARLSLREWLNESGIVLFNGKRSSRKPWQLAFDIETRLGNASPLNAALKELGGQKNLTPRRRDAVPTDVTGEEADLLADWLLEAPGAIIARTLRRHDQGVATDIKMLRSATRFSWRQLRPYLGQRYFASAVLGRKRAASKDRYPAALRRALLEGGFEATLDEHMAVMMLIGNDKPIDVLRASLLGRSGFVRRRPARGRARRVPVHVAVPYLGAERHSGRPGRSSETLRSDLLRRGFNSPFWPYVLSTTSIGQEGLDFHVWCDRVIHWDLPRDPVDFEQREGRISRYAGLGVRRSLAQAHGAGHLTPWQSPFTAIFKAAQEMKGEGLGIQRWWSPPGHKPVSVTFSVSFSCGDQRLQRLKSDLVRYRLALGQPDPLMFEALILDLKLNSEQARSLALNLSAAAPTI